MFDQDEAAISERNRERAREAGAPRREERWALEEGAGAWVGAIVEHWLVFQLGLELPLRKIRVSRQGLRFRGNKC